MQGSQPGRMSETRLGSALFQEGLSSRATQAGGRLAQLLHVPDQAVVAPAPPRLPWAARSCPAWTARCNMWASVSHECSVPSAMGTKQS